MDRWWRRWRYGTDRTDRVQGGAVAATRAAVVEALALVEQLPGASQLDLEARSTQVRSLSPQHSQHWDSSVLQRWVEHWGASALHHCWLLFVSAFN